MSTEADLLKRLPNVQWRLDNIEAIESLLSEYEARVRQDGDRLLLQAVGGLSTHLNPGDCLLLDGDCLGIIRAKTDADQVN